MSVSACGELLDGPPLGLRFPNLKNPLPLDFFNVWVGKGGTGSAGEKDLADAAEDMSDMED